MADAVSSSAATASEGSSPLPPASMRNHCPSTESDEVGYLFLEEGQVRIVSDETRGLCSVGVSARTWIDVEWEASVTESLDMKRPPSLGPTDKQGNDEPEEKVCARCDLVLHHESKENAANSSQGDAVKLVLKRAPHFSGTLPDMVAQTSACSLSCTRAGNRSDAALLAGVAFTCQFNGYVVIRRVQIMLLSRPHRGDAEGSSACDETTGESESAAGSVNVALLITLAMPQLTSPSRHQESRSIVPSDSVSPKNRMRAIKPLPPCTQLLLSIMRSDWAFLEMRITRLSQKDWSESKRSSMYQMQRDGTLTKMKRTMFPNTLTLEELYLQFRGVSISDESTAETDHSSLLTSLPQDLLVAYLAPFLRARSLEALRQSCKFLYRTLRAVVPGLKLRLYKHQIRSLEWMRRRETEELSEECIRDSDSSVQGIEGVKGDMHRAVTGGASTCLRLHPSSRASRKSFRIDQQTGREISFETTTKQSFALSRHVARGGLLCDDPGLGKTITVLAMILQTSGLSTEPLGAAVNAGTYLSHTDEDIFQAYWREHVPQIFRVQCLSKILGTLRRHSPAARIFELPVDPFRDSCPNYFDIIDRPICFKDIDKLIKGKDYGYDFEQFRADIDQCFLNAMAYNDSGHPIHEAAAALSRVLAGMVNEFKAEQVQSAKKSFSRSCAKPNSSVAALLERRNYEELLSSLKPTAGTLLVVPGTLLNHWEEQVKLHVNLAYITEKIPLIYHYTGNEFGEVYDLCRIQKTHSPVVFIDKAGTKPLPPADFLAMFQIVLTTNQRFTNEWKHGSFEEELKKRNGDEHSSVPYEVRASAYRSTSACSLLKVHWLRLIVDEGHSMGRCSNNSTILFASWVMAQRRWAMTGTPTPQTVSHSGLTNLLGLMRFLQHDFFSARLEGERIWQSSIARSWNNGNLSGFFRLQALMSLLMVRHTKLDIEELQPPRFRRTFSTMSTEEIKAYNSLVCALQANLLITSMEGETSGRQDSILFRSNAKLAREAFNNLRLVCCGRWDVVPTIKNDLIQETIDMLRALGVADFRLKVVENYIHRAVTDQLSSCNLCGLQLSTLLIVPCGHLICTECMDSDTSSCAVCEEPFNIDTFQRVQPGIALTWHESREKEKMKKVVTVDAGTGEESSPAQEMNIAERIAMQPPRVRRRTRRFGDGHVCEYDVASPEGKCTLCFEEHSECVMVDRSRCNVCFKTAETCPEEESKAFYLSTKLKELHSEYAGSVGQHFDSRRSRMLEKRPLKVIVFSEFQKTMNQVGNRLLRRFGPGCVAEFWGQTRGLELSKFAKSPECFCMLLGKAGSEGLDLSFVTHIFFLEEVWDKSLENQVISRAWRMGAKGQVEVEIIAARGTVEETMMGVEQALSSTTRVSSETSNASNISAQKKELSSVKEHQRAKLLFLLQDLKLIRPQRAEETSTVSNNAKRPREVRNVGEDTEAPKKLPRVQFHESTVGDYTEAPEERPRVRFHESTRMVSSSLDREHGVSVSFASPSPRPLSVETKAGKPLHSCSSCGQDKTKDEFSKKQPKKGSEARCITCVGT